MIKNIDNAKMLLQILLIFLLSKCCVAEDFETSAAVECSCSGSVVTAIILTLLIVAIIGLSVYCFYTRKKTGEHLIKVDPEAAHSAAYDNPHFQSDEVTPSNNGNRKSATAVSGNSTSPGAPMPGDISVSTSPVSNTNGQERGGMSTLERVMAAVRGGKTTPRKTLDDSTLMPLQRTMVPLQARDFTGLGFSVKGTLRDGIFVNDVQTRGPAYSSGKVAIGDRMVALTIVTEHMVHKDAVALLSYAAPYPILLHLEKGIQEGPKLKTGSASPAQGTPLSHPAFRSMSFNNGNKVPNFDMGKLKLADEANLHDTNSKSSVLPQAQKLSQLQLVQRSSEGRHSERAIDVPGVETHVRVNTEKKQAHIERPMSPTWPNMTSDEIGVEVHFPGSSSRKNLDTKIDIDTPDMSVGFTPIEKKDKSSISKLSTQVINVDINESKLQQKRAIDRPISPITPSKQGGNSQDVLIDSSTPKPTSNVSSSKLKFGVKVLPTVDLSSKFSPDKHKSDEEASKLTESREVKPSILIENETKESIESEGKECEDKKDKERKSSFGLNMGFKLPKFKNSFKDKELSPDSKDSVEPRPISPVHFIVDPNVKSPNAINKEASLNIISQQPKTDDEKQFAIGKYSENFASAEIALASPDISIDQKISIDSKITENKICSISDNELSNSDNEKISSEEKTGFGLKIKGPDIKLPSFLNDKKGSKPDKVKKADDETNKKLENKLDEKDAFDLKFKKLPDINSIGVIPDVSGVISANKQTFNDDLTSKSDSVEIGDKDVHITLPEMNVEISDIDTELDADNINIGVDNKPMSAQANVTYNVPSEVEDLNVSSVISKPNFDIDTNTNGENADDIKLSKGIKFNVNAEPFIPSFFKNNPEADTNVALDAKAPDIIPPYCKLGNYEAEIGDIGIAAESDLDSTLNINKNSLKLDMNTPDLNVKLPMKKEGIEIDAHKPDLTCFGNDSSIAARIPDSQKNLQKTEADNIIDIEMVDAEMSAKPGINFTGFKIKSKGFTEDDKVQSETTDELDEKNKDSKDKKSSFASFKFKAPDPAFLGFDKTGPKSGVDYNIKLGAESGAIAKVKSRDVESKDEEETFQLKSPDIDIDIDALNPESDRALLNRNMKQEKDFTLDSSTEIESDLPEADSDLKLARVTASSDFQDDIPEAEANINNSKDFGSAFGFKGFKKHIDLTRPEIELDADSAVVQAKNSEVSLKQPIIENPNLNKDNSVDVESSINNNHGLDIDLDEVDNAKIALRQREIGENELDDEEKSKKKFGIGFGFKAKLSHKISDSEVEKHNLNEKRDKEKDDDTDKLTNKGKNKLGIGFGFKGLGRASDSEDTEVENKISSYPEADKYDNKEKKKVKNKMSFGFKGFGKSSSDTEDDTTGKVSEAPMEKGPEEEKTKLKSKAGIGFGFRSKSNKGGSDSEDNADAEKVEMDPHTDTSGGKQRLMPSLSFGFKGKSKSHDNDPQEPTEISSESSKRETDAVEEDQKQRKSSINFGIMNFSKSERQSDSETAGEYDEKCSYDTRGDDIKEKQLKYHKNTSDSEGFDGDEREVHDKVKDPKNKSLKLGFKGFKNLKVKIKKEINNMRNDSPSSDEDTTGMSDEQYGQDGKRKKSSKKKDKDKKHKKDSERQLDSNEENALTMAAAAAKDNRRKRTEKILASSSDDDSFDEDDNKSEFKKKKRKSKKVEEARLLSTGIMNVVIPDLSTNIEVHEDIKLVHHPLKVESIKTDIDVTSPINISNTIVNDSINTTKRQAPSPPVLSEPTVNSNIVVKEMKLKNNISEFVEAIDTEVIEVIKKEVAAPKINNMKLQNEIKIHHNLPSANFSEWASDSDNEKSKEFSIHGKNNRIEGTTIHLNNSQNQNNLTDSEELKRRAASMGDLSRLHDDPSRSSVILERAVSLDLKSAEVSVNSGKQNLHVHRLQLPDSSATSIDEEDEPASNAFSKPWNESVGFMKKAGQWGTLEEALQLHSSKHDNTYINEIKGINDSIKILDEENDIPEGGPVSHIEISDGKGASVTELSVANTSWTTEDEEDTPPALPTSPIPIGIGATTIAVSENEPKINKIQTIQVTEAQESNVVVIPSEPEEIDYEKINNINLHLRSTTPVNYNHGTTTINYTSNAQSSSSSRSSLTSDSDSSMSPRHDSMKYETDKDCDVVTVMSVPGDQGIAISSKSIPPPVPPKPRKNSLSPPELMTIEDSEPPIVTVTHGWTKENGDISSEDNENTFGETYMIGSPPSPTPQKSLTQITVDGGDYSGYTVTDGPFSRTVIISTSNSSNINVVPTDLDSIPPTLQPPE